MNAQKKVAVPGATGRLGRHLVDILTKRGHDVVPMSPSTGVDLVTRDGLADALAGVEVVIDAATGPSPDPEESMEFFTTSARNLQELGEAAGVERIVVVSIIETDKFEYGYYRAKTAQEQTHLSGPVEARIVRAAQFHEFVSQLLEWGRQGEVSYVPKWRTQLVAARTVAETLADQVNVSTEADSSEPPIEIAGPRAESLVEAATLLVARRGDPVRVEGASDPDDPDRDLFENGGLLPGPDATLAGPTFEEWVDATERVPA